MAKLGDMVVDRLTGYRGVVTGRAEFLYGCIRLQVQSEAMKDGKPVEECWFDEDRMGPDPAAAVPAPPSAPERRGGPTSNPTRAADATR